jgi:hypothetical protein
MHFVIKVYVGVAIYLHAPLILLGGEWVISFALHPFYRFEGYPFPMG